MWTVAVVAAFTDVQLVLSGINCSQLLAERHLVF